MTLKMLLARLLIMALALLAGGDALPVFIATAATQAAAPAKPAVETTQPPVNATRAAREEKALQDARRQQLAEKEAALAAKEQELKKLSTRLEEQVKELDESKKRLDEAVKAKTEAAKKTQNESIQKMVKLFKTIKGEQAGKMIDTMKEEMALTLLSRMDTKSVAKLVPYISQPRVLKWVSDNMQGNK